jgi:cytosine/adenosine deaminase-related metal-dependent hydrolase
LFEGAQLIVGDGSEPIMDSAFFVEDGTFTLIGRRGELQPAEGVVRVDLSGKTVMPAIIDAHSHLGYTNVKGMRHPPPTSRERTSSTIYVATRTTGLRRR